MTKKQNPFEEDEIDQDSEPLKFEEASSLFEEDGNPNTEPAKAEEVQEVKSQEASEPVEPEQDFSLDKEGDEDMASTIGAFLRQIREEKSINLKIISQHTKISVSNLEKLEADDLDALPNRAYVIGYVKSYAKALQLNQDDCLELLDMTYGIEKEVIVKETSDKVKTNDSKSSSKKSEDGEGQNIKIGIAIGALAIIAFLLILNNTGKQEELPEEVVQEEVQPVKEESKEVIPQTLGASTPLKETNSSPEENIAEKIELKPKPLATPVPVKQLEEIKKEVKKEEVKKEEIKVVEVKKVEEKKEEPKVEKEDAKKDEKISFKPLAKVLYQEDPSITGEEFNQLLPNKYRAAIIEGQQNVFINANKADSLSLIHI